MRSKGAIALLLGGSVLLGLPTPALADWVLVGQNSNGDQFHVREDTVTLLANSIVVFDTRINYAQPQENGTVATIDRFVADCRTNRVTNVSWAMLNANSEIIQSSVLPALQANVALRGTLMEAEIGRACQAARQ